MDCDAVAGNHCVIHLSLQRLLAVCHSQQRVQLIWLLNPCSLWILQHCPAILQLSTYWRINGTLNIHRLTHWNRDKAAAIFQATFINAFSWIKRYEFRIRFDWNLFPKDQLSTFEHWFRWWIGAEHALDLTFMIFIYLDIFYQCIPEFFFRWHK